MVGLIEAQSDAFWVPTVAGLTEVVQENMHSTLTTAKLGPSMILLKVVFLGRTFEGAGVSELEAAISLLEKLRHAH